MLLFLLLAGCSGEPDQEGGGTAAQSEAAADEPESTGPLKPAVTIDMGELKAKALTFTPDGKNLVVFAEGADEFIRVYDAKSGKKLTEIAVSKTNGAKFFNTPLLFVSPNGELLALMDVVSVPDVVICDLSNGTTVSKIAETDLGNPTAGTVVFNADNTTAIFPVYHPNKVRRQIIRYDIAAGTAETVYDTTKDDFRVECFAMLDDSNAMAIGGWVGVGVSQAQIHVLELGSGAVRKIELGKGVPKVLQVSPDGSTLRVYFKDYAEGDEFSGVIQVNLKTGKATRLRKVEQNRYAFLAGGQLVHDKRANYDRNPVVVDGETELGVLDSGGTTTSVIVSSVVSHRVAATCESSKQIRIFDVSRWANP